MSYSVSYFIAWLNAALGVIAGALAASYLVLHPSWLTQDIAATATIIATITVGLAQILPPLQRTPAKRENKYNAALAGKLPDDLIRKRAQLLSRSERTV